MDQGPAPWTAAANVGLGPVALCLSGGGFRAAGFHLGALALLDEVGLLDQVAAISMVSGGSLVGGAWLHARASEPHLPFSAFYTSFQARLRDERLMASAVVAATATSGERGFSLIRGMADTYDRLLFGAARFGALLDAPQVPRHIIFNATEFSGGKAFRFQRTDSGGSGGCGAIPVPTPELRRLRLADIVAASSCFPGGFEPIVFPDDFADAAPVGPGRPVALMDGGIYDNQGIEAVLDLLDAAAPLRPGLVILSDSAQAKDQFFQAPPPSVAGGPPLASLFYAAIALSAALTLALFGQAMLLFQSGHPLFACFNLLLGALALLPAGGLVWLRRIGRRALAEAIPQVPLDMGGALSLPQALQAASVRVRSLSALTGNVFLGRVRDLVYKRFYTNSNLRNRRISNLLYRIPEKTLAADRLAKHGWRRPDTLGLPTDVDAVKHFATTLWFWEPEQLSRLVRVGYASMCFNLGEHLLLRYGDDPSQWPSEAQAVWTRCQAIWNAGARREG